MRNIKLSLLLFSQTVHLEGIREIVLDGFKLRVHKFALLLKELNIYTSDLLVSKRHFDIRKIHFIHLQESWAKALQAELEQQRKQQPQQQQSISVSKAPQQQQQQQRYNYQIKVTSDTLKPPACPKQYRAVNTAVISNTNANTTNAGATITTPTPSPPPSNSNVVNGVEATS